MEFLTLIILTVTVFLILYKPHNEKLAFSLFLIATVLTIGMHSIATIGSLLPSGNY